MRYCQPSRLYSETEELTVRLSLNSAPQRTARVQTDELDMASMDEKWDEANEQIDEESSRISYAPSQPSQAESEGPHRPVSAPPIGVMLDPDTTIDDARKFSLNLPRS